jgi:hypothetical protein
MTFINKEARGQTAFIDNLEISDGKAETIKNALLGKLNELGIDIKKVVGFGSDGASVMTGCRSGVGMQLRQSGAEFLIHIHCAAHRISLALSQAAKSVPAINNIELILDQMYHFFDASPIRENVFREICEINDNSNIKLKEPKQIRWLSFYDAAIAAHKTYPSILEALSHIAENSKDVKAKGLLQKLKHKSFPALLSICLDILEPIKKLTNLFQYENVTFSKIRPLVVSCISTLENLKQVKGTHQTSLEQQAVKMVDDEETGEPLFLTSRSNKEYNEDNLKSIKLEFINRVIENLNARFPKESLEILNALSVILQPKSYPLGRNDLNEYGVQSLNILIDYFTTSTVKFLDKNELLTNFFQFKCLVMSFKNLDLQDFAHILIKEYGEDFPEFAKLARIALVIPVSSAAAERGFSCMKRIKTSLRNRLTEKKIKKFNDDIIRRPTLNGSK